MAVPLRIAKGLASARATDVLITLTSHFDPEIHEAIWTVGGFGAGGFSLEPREGGQMIAIEELEGQLSVADVHDFEAAGYIRVHKKQDHGTWAFRPTQLARDLVKTPARVQGTVAANKALRIEEGATPSGESVTGMIGRQIKQYRIDGPLGAGGMGQVFLAYDTQLERKIAIKVIHRLLLGDAEARKRFLLEARVVARLQHAGVVTLHDMGFEGDAPYLVFEYLDGEGLDQRLGRGPLPLANALRLVRDLVSALAYAHGQGIVHRDLKPKNVFLTSGGVIKVLDFGLVKMLAPENGQGETLEQITSFGARRGTPGFMASEQAYGGVVTAATDVFTLGLLIHMMVSGRHPFHRSTYAEVQDAIARGEPVVFPDPLPGLPLGLAEVVRRCLARDPGLRFQNAGQVEAALAEIHRSPNSTAWDAKPPIAEGGRGEAASSPTLAPLSFEYEEGAPGYLQTREGLTGQANADVTFKYSERLYRVKVVNSSAQTVRGVRVTVSSMTGSNLEGAKGVLLDHRLRVTDYGGGEIDIYPHAGQFFDVITHRLEPELHAIDDLLLCYRENLEIPDLPTDPGAEYHLTLRAQGDGVAPVVKSFMVRMDANNVAHLQPDQPEDRRVLSEAADVSDAGADRTTQRHGKSPNEDAQARLEVLKRDEALAAKIESVGLALQRMTMETLELLLSEAQEKGLLHHSSAVSLRSDPGPVFALANDDLYRRRCAVQAISYSLWSLKQQVNMSGWLQVEVPVAPGIPLLVRHVPGDGPPETLATVDAGAADVLSVGSEAARNLWASLVGRLVDRLEAKRRGDLA